MTPQQLLDTFETPQAAYDQTAANLRAGLDHPSCPCEFRAGRRDPWEVLDDGHLRNYWSGHHLGRIVPITLPRKVLR